MTDSADLLAGGRDRRAIVAIWLGFQILGFVLKLVIFVAAVVLAVAAFRAWGEARRMTGGALIVIAFFFGLAAGVVGKIKGSSFFVWFLIGLCLPGIGLVAAILYRFERDEPRRRCPRCGSVRPIADQVCTVCGEDMDWPEPEAVVPAQRR